MGEHLLAHHLTSDRLSQTQELPESCLRRTQPRKYALPIDIQTRMSNDPSQHQEWPSFG